ncbi:MAG TPA: MarC family protein [Candidatus Nanopelagicales bacterium]|nr:MarC family protein [Candidatus Nanopelagicales bacterium]
MDWKFLASVYLALFVIMDPPGVIPVFLALTARRGSAAMARSALQAAATSFGVIVLFAVLGDRILSFLGITLPAMQVSGGLLLLVVSLELLTGRTDEPTEVDDVNVAMVPLGTPLLAGPGAIVATILFVRSADTAPETLALVVAIVAIHVTIYLVMRFSVVARADPASDRDPRPHTDRRSAGRRDRGAARCRRRVRLHRRARVTT